jgi:phosphoribosyl 1,2-cyclic phosphodiesterase
MASGRKKIMKDKTKITFLGTSASPSVPIPFCTCDSCKNALKKGGRNFRKKSAILINDDLLIDIGPDIPNAFCEYKIDSSLIKTILQTHAHEDHFDPELLIARNAEYGSKIENEILFAASQGTLDLIDQKIMQFGYGSIFDKNLQEALKIKIEQIEPFTEYCFRDYSVIGFPANHDKENESLIFSINTNTGSIFYGTDTSILDERIWEYLKSNNFRFDILILDHTYGIGFNSTDHLGNDDFIKHIQRFQSDGLLKSNCRILGTHISHEGIKCHDDFKDYTSKNEYELAFDGLELFI